jgi:hypothetical protein
MLSERDFKKIWALLDKDSSGKISCDEFKDVVRAYENVQPQYTEITFDERLGRTPFDPSVGEPSEDSKALDGTLIIS